MALDFPLALIANHSRSRTSSAPALRASRRDPIRYLAVVDGEHYPPVTAGALSSVDRRGDKVVAAVLVGGREKLAAGGLDRLGDIEVVAGGDPRALLDEAITRFEPQCVLDLSDEPVLDYRRRHQLISVALAREVSYEGADFRFDPPPRPRLATRPSVAVAGTGKRTGKTSVAGYAARELTKLGRRPVMVAMGRGGPESPEVLRGDRLSLAPHHLLELADEGRHAASDYVEDALLARVPTVGCRRCGGGLAGGVEFSNVAEGVAIANDLPGDLLVVEGSGSALPPVYADVTVLVVPATIPDEYLAGYLGPYRLLLADFVVVTMCENPFATPSRVSEIASLVNRAYRSAGDSQKEAGGEIQVTRTVFRPSPTRSVEGATVFVATTAPDAAADHIKRHLEREFGCEVAGISHCLSDRARLTEELAAAGGGAEILLCEIKGAGVDVATRWALKEGLEVVYMDNVPRGVDGDDPKVMVANALELAAARFAGGR